MQIPIDRALVDDARRLAEAIVAPVMHYIRAHSTVSVERSALRLMGVDGTDAEGVPWPNRAVDAVAAAGRLDRGICTWIAGANVKKGLTPQDAAEYLAGGDVDWDALVLEAAELERWGHDQAHAALDTLWHRRHERVRFKERLGMGPTPWRYLIVATGNIYEDVPQAVAAARQGADIIAVIRATAQSLLDYVPYGPTSEGSGGTYATGANFRLLRQALDEVSTELGRYVMGTNYASGLCMPEISVLAAQEGLDMLLNDALYGILFRDINLYRTLTDQYFSRLVNGFSGIIINTGEDNYLTTADAVEKAHTVLASQFVNEAFAKKAGVREEQMGLGHAFEIDPWIENSFLFELAQAQLVRQVFPKHPIKWMPPTKHKTGDIFQSHVHDAMFNLVGVMTHQSIELLGMFSEAVHNPMLMDRYLSLKSTKYVFNTARALGDEIMIKPDGIMAKRAEQVLDEALELLEQVKAETIWSAIERGAFADVKRTKTGGKGYAGVVARAKDYVNPILSALETGDR